MAKHVVRQGECLSSIAAKHGFGDWRTIYDHPKNAELKKKRPDPNMLFPGDEVFVPERKARKLTVKTGQEAKITVKVSQRELHLRLLDDRHRPLKDAAYTIEAPGLFRAGVADAEGKLEEVVPGDVPKVEVYSGGRRWVVDLAGLNPASGAPDDGISGVQGRLRNLGYGPAWADGVLGPETRAALSAFQRDHGLKVDGEVNRDTLEKLEEIHGS